MPGSSWTFAWARNCMGAYCQNHAISHACPLRGPQDHFESPFQEQFHLNGLHRRSTPRFVPCHFVAAGASGNNLTPILDHSAPNKGAVVASAMIRAEGEEDDP